MLKLQIFSTARAIRRELQLHREQNGFPPKLMRIDEFEKNIAIVPKLSMVNPTQRVLFLKEASKFEEFNKLKTQKELVKFFSQSDDFFKFFEELSWERVDINSLLLADSYAEFEEHVSILLQLKKNYKEILNQNGFTDRMFIPENFTINDGFIESFDSIEIFLDGYLSRFEIELLQEVAKKRELIVNIRTTKYNQKMIERFSEIGVSLPQNSKISFSLSSGKILSSKSIPLKINAKVYSLQNRLEQVAIIFGEVEKMIQKGIKPESIAIILPDENFAETIALYDRLNNYNFAMGFKFIYTKTYRKLKAISNYYRDFDRVELLNFYKIPLEKISLINPSSLITIDDFFKTISSFEIEGLVYTTQEALDSIRIDKNSTIATLFLQFHQIFQNLKLPFKEWLYLWLREIESIRVNDIRGGKVTVMGVLETRGVEFDGVVICDFNEGLVPTISSKDRFLNSTVRKSAKLPTKDDRDALQRYYYSSLMERAKSVVILYSNSNDSIASKFLYELNLPKPKEIKAPLEILYKSSTKILSIDDSVVESFDAKSMEWSATKLKVWLSCKRKFYYRYILNIEAKPQDDINVGAVLHGALKHTFKKNYFDSKSELIKLFADSLEKYRDDKKATYNYLKRVWINSMDRFFSNQIKHFKSGWRVYSTEESVSGEIKGLKFVGKIDRVDVLSSNPKQALIIDYKSNKTSSINVKSNLNNLKDFQMSIYQILMESKFNKLETLFCEILDEGDLIPLNEPDRKREVLLEKIDELLKVTNFETKKCDDFHLCRFCEYRVMCQRGEFV